MDLKKLRKVSESLNQTEDSSGQQSSTHASMLQGIGAINFEEIERKAKEHQQQMMFDMARDSIQDMNQRQTELWRRENVKVEYARRSAEASEAALEAERQRTAAAIEDARTAREDARIARSHMRASLWLAAASLVLAAWALLKDQPFW